MEDLNMDFVYSVPDLCDNKENYTLATRTPTKKTATPTQLQEIPVSTDTGRLSVSALGPLATNTPIKSPIKLSSSNNSNLAVTSGPFPVLSLGQEAPSPLSPSSQTGCLGCASKETQYDELLAAKMQLENDLRNVINTRDLTTNELVKLTAQLEELKSALVLQQTATNIAVEENQQQQQQQHGFIDNSNEAHTDLTERILTLQHEKDQLENQLHGLQQSAENLTVEANNAAIQRRAMEEEIISLRVRDQERNGHMAKLMEKQQEVDARLAQAGHKQDLLTQENDRLEKQLQELLETNSALQAQAKASPPPTDEGMGADSETGRVMIKVLMTNTSALEQEVEALKSSLAEAQGNVGQREARIREIETQLAAHERTAGEMQGSLMRASEELKAAQEVANTLRHEIELTHQREEEAQAGCQSQARELETVMGRMNRLQEENEQLNRTLLIHVNQHEKELKDIDQKYQHDAYQARYRDQLTRNNALEDRMAVIQASLNALNTVDFAQDELSNATASCLAKLQIFIEQSRRTQQGLSDQLAASQGETASLRQTNDLIRSQLDEMTQNIANLNDERTLLNGEIQSRDQQLAELLQQVAEWEQLIGVAQERDRDMQAAKDAIKNELDSVTVRLQSTKDELASVQEDSSQAKAKVQSHEATLRKQWGLLKEYKGRSESMEATIAKITMEMEEQGQQAKEELEFVTNERNSNANQLRASETKLATASSTVDQLNSTIEHLRTQLSDWSSMVDTLFAVSDHVYTTMTSLRVCSQEDLPSLLQTAVTALGSFNGGMAPYMQSAASRHLTLADMTIRTAHGTHSTQAGRVSELQASLKDTQAALEEYRSQLAKTSKQLDVEMAERDAAIRKAGRADDLLKQLAMVKTDTARVMEQEKATKKALCDVQEEYGQYHKKTIDKMAALHEAIRNLEQTVKDYQKENSSRQKTIQSLESELQDNQAKMTTLQQVHQQMEEKYTVLKGCVYKDRAAFEKKMDQMRVNRDLAEKEVATLDAVLYHVKEVLEAHKDLLQSQPVLFQLLLQLSPDTMSSGLASLGASLKEKAI